MQFDIVINWCSDKGNDNSQIKDRTTSQESQEFSPFAWELKIFRAFSYLPEDPRPKHGPMMLVAYSCRAITLDNWRERPSGCLLLIKPCWTQQTGSATAAATERKLKLIPEDSSAHKIPKLLPLNIYVSSSSCFRFFCVFERSSNSHPITADRVRNLKC